MWHTVLRYIGLFYLGRIVSKMNKVSPGLINLGSRSSKIDSQFIDQSFKLIIMSIGLLYSLACFTRSISEEEKISQSGYRGGAPCTIYIFFLIGKCGTNKGWMQSFKKKMHPYWLKYHKDPRFFLLDIKGIYLSSTL